jgi:hypothetical protein
MATTQQLRNAIRRLSTAAASDLEIVWRQTDSADTAREALSDVLPPLIDDYGAAAATVAAEWYDERRAQTSARRRFAARVAPLRDGGGALVLARYAVGPLFRPEPDFQTAKSLAAMGVQLRIANAARDTITDSAISDPAAQGWQRETSGGCAFCEMLASRGTVYSEAGADFASHDACQCVAVPAFEGEPRPVQPYTPSPRNITDADRARVREYIRTH